EGLCTAMLNLAPSCGPNGTAFILPRFQNVRAIRLTLLARPSATPALSLTGGESRCPCSNRGLREHEGYLRYFAPRAIGAPSDSSSIWRIASALQTIFAEWRTPSVSSVPRSTKCRSMVSAWSIDFPLAQCKDWPGLCCSLPVKDTFATSIRAEVK